MNLLRKILLPIVPVYYFVTWLRNKMYDLGLKKSVSYDFPVIAVGNLSVGGTGKSPMVEYLIRLLKDKVSLATLSRGYKRETKGFLEVEVNATAKDVGDEPLQFKTKFTNVTVAVDGDRRNGIRSLKTQNPNLEVILLDDAYQHRKVKAGFYILLTPYYDLYCNDIVLPTGNLREPRSGADRADIIVVTKCPNNLGDETMQEIEKKLRVKPSQALLFSTIDYGNNIINASDRRSLDTLKRTSFTLVTGIANPKPLLEYYHSLGLNFNHINYPDHHNFTDTELDELKKYSLIITTEKDYVRLAPNFSEDALWYQPIEMKFIKNQDVFDNYIVSYIKK
ncbi:tetraacyldisaccharide 4'-kinase [Aquimarina sp. BL5]|uniref:tetraacyldisaccharide 4'-kinase n=1 Tax=Aquimarina sp. BL5 TaxID=1714860 RepID=UPI000E472759|nr:tetraacyldisaccharide 4'-kinase [Aquimarina sp. BL5]AXT53119.1 tetraacyldisaccharide 4'-kinase [Aquimarina sp. BL5]RKN03695.1 tetraacyldisaccharide 4'-kinase [Aquimarina sp. BL5]